MDSRTPSLAALMGVVFVGMTGFGIFFPIFPFLGLYLGARPTEITIALGAYSLGQLVAAPAWGRLSDRIGRKPVLIAGLSGAALSYLLLAQAHSILGMGLARLFGGLMAGNIGAAFAVAGDLGDVRTRARNMGLLSAAFGSGFIAGPVVGAFLIGQHPTRTQFDVVCLAAAGCAVVAALGAFLLFRESLPKHADQAVRLPRVRRLELLTKRPTLARLVLVMLLMVTAQALIESTVALWANVEFHWGPRQVGWALGGLGLGAALLQGGGAGRVAHAIGERRMLLVGLFMFSLGFLLMTAASYPFEAISAFVTLTLGVGLAQPSLQSLISAEAADTERGAVMGVSQSASALGRVIGPLTSGAIFDRFGHNAPFAAGAGLLALAFLVVASARRIPVLED